VKGHSGNPDNERADQLAREAIRAGRSAGENLA
jgi:ribonuclease HI